jgi:hypothetical protein
MRFDDSLALKLIRIIRFLVGWVSLICNIEYHEFVSN